VRDTAIHRGLLASPPAQRNLVLALLLAAAASCWAWLFLVAGGGMAGMEGGDTGTMTSSPTRGMAAPAFLVTWAAMMAAMMFPTASPMVLTFHCIQSGNRERGEAFVSTWMFVSGYIAVWAAAGLVAYSAALMAERLAALLGLTAEGAARLGGGLLIASGLYQLTPLKNICLSKCRSPIGFIMTAWREGRSGALRMGAVHGATCLGCCWMLMAILFPLGLMNAAVMVLVMLVVFAEKALAWERVAVWGTAAVLMLYGAAVVAAPHLLPTSRMAASGMKMDMPAMDKPVVMPGMPGNR
jgi:predicted metal-binding membrane protein